MLVTWELNVNDATSISLYRDDELVAEPASDVLSYVDAGLDANTRYEYRIEVGRRDASDALDHGAVATLAHPPRFTDQRNSHWSGFQVPIVDELNPQHTEYRVTVSGGGSDPVISDWASGKCRTFDGLRPSTRYGISVAARNLDGIEVHATNLGNLGEIPRLVYYTRYWEASDDPWVEARVGDVSRIYGLTEAAADWITNGIGIEWMRAEPVRFSYTAGGRVRVGHTRPWSIMHEVMHAFWPHWDGFPEPCDQMNVYTFRSDVAQFVLDFREHDRSESPNPWEPWRIYYDWMVRLLENDTPDGGDYWDILERREFHKLNGLFFHLMETSLPAHAAGKMDLIPPPLQKYLQGFLKQGGSTTWAAKAEWYSKLMEEDRRLWQVVNRGLNNWTPLELNVEAAAADTQHTRIDDSLRGVLRAAERQPLLDFIDTLHEVATLEWWERAPRFWYDYATNRISLVPLYLHELDWSAGLKLDETGFGAVVESLRSISRLHAGEVEWPDVHESISGIEGLSEPQRTALFWMLPERPVSISIGGTHNCGLRSDGTAVCWGSNSWGASSPPEGEMFRSIDSGWGHTCGLRPDGAAVCWGLEQSRAVVTTRGRGLHNH